MAEVKSPSNAKRLWIWVGTIGLVAGTLGYFGYAADYQDPEHLGGARDALYNTLGLFVFNGPPWTQPDMRLEIARFLAPLATGFAGFTAVYTLFSEQILGWRLRRKKGHVVICGLGYKGFTFVQRLDDAGYDVVAIESDVANPSIDDCRERDVPVVIGDAQHGPILRRAGVQRAKWLLAVCPDDATNTEIMLTARSVVKERAGEPLQCLAQISNPQLCSMLRVSQIKQAVPGWSADFFNTDDTSAGVMLDQYPIDAEGAKSPHIVIAHLDPLGQRLLVLAVQRWLIRRERDAKTRRMPLWITVIDDNAEAGIQALKRQHAVLRNDCVFVTSSTSPADVSDLRSIYTVRAAPKPARAFVTSSDDNQNVVTALLLLNHIDIPVDIVVALSRKQGTGKLLHSLQDVKVKVFATFEMTCTQDLLFPVSVERLAKEIHEIWREEQIEAGTPDPPGWDNATDVHRTSSLAQAHDIPAKVRSINCSIVRLREGEEPKFDFTTDEIERLAFQEHDRWVAERRNAGWTDGPKDNNAKRSPYLVPFGDLPPDVAEWDRVFVRTIPRILKQAGQQIVRNQEANGASE